ncbi:MAG: hypothetical protein JO013_10670 [Alphaproteobacteria bacterium]|nr:hypothetical protein [Alphaproteobacteria bacterium]
MSNLFDVLAWTFLGPDAALQTASKPAPRLPKQARPLWMAFVASALLCFGLSYSPLGRDYPAGRWGEWPWWGGALVMLVAVMTEAAVEARRRW